MLTLIDLQVASTANKQDLKGCDFLGTYCGTPTDVLDAVGIEILEMKLKKRMADAFLGEPGSFDTNKGGQVSGRHKQIIEKRKKKQTQRKMSI